MNIIHDLVYYHPQDHNYLDSKLIFPLPIYTKKDEVYTKCNMYKLAPYVTHLLMLS